MFVENIELYNSFQTCASIYRTMLFGILSPHTKSNWKREEENTFLVMMTIVVAYRVEGQEKEKVE